ncbi:ATP synthase subunit B family protein [Pedobacter paludis]|uniref:Uncharacterized protein n=1 Tax=Pedobacter paludis TaxID=2203212 RepID=A0A317EWV8_9SPHI|nr:hypothetical protein [Pedobacter paludis]PWS30327.1 hypothetical protein DF947_18020 [Pedobacter paludis]
MKPLFIWLAISIIIFVVILWYGQKSTFDALARKKGYIKATEALSDIDKLILYYEDKLKEVQQEPKTNGYSDNPFGSYLFPLVKVSSLYSIKDHIDKELADGKMSEADHKMKSDWLANEIVMKTGKDYYDDTTINLDV